MDEWMPSSLLQPPKRACMQSPTTGECTSVLLTGCTGKRDWVSVGTQGHTGHKKGVNILIAFKFYNFRL